MKLFVLLFILSASLNAHAQTTSSAKVEKANYRQCFDFVKSKDDSGTPIYKAKSESEIIGIYVITYSENNCHTKEPKLVYQEKGTTLDELRAWIKQTETDENYKFNSFNYVNTKRPYGLIYSIACGNGQRKYLMGVYTTLDAARKKCKSISNSTSSSNYKCEQFISLYK